MVSRFATGLAALTWGFAASAPGAQEAEPEFQPFTFAGTVVAREITGLSYETAGCITAVSDIARRTGTAKSGQMLVALDSQDAELALETARARVADLEAAVAEKQLAIDAAEANVARRAQELEFVGKEFARNEQMFRRGLINESTMEGVESRMMNANFAADQAGETLASAKSAKTRAEIALEIGQLDLTSQQVALEALQLHAPYDGVLLGFEPNVGDCVSAGASAAQIYAPEKKSVEVFVRVDQLVAQQSSGVTVGAPVRIARINGQSCGGSFTWIGTEADLEHQYVKSAIEVDEACAAALYLNEAVEIETLPNPA
ncbi:HlyD family secretion protein [Marinovum sp.]|uniref:HlyD family secretion protein n=1 Tax=Marinovum sp. TaxID=2024839 RepID=UPI002B265B28|nr:HlyD family efflux transporter periplasmic adaptor subunit [Marinovum sp.]